MTIQEQLARDYVDAPAAAAEFEIDKSHLCLQLRAGKIPGAFRWGKSANAPWIIPRAGILAYLATHTDRDRYRRKK